MHCSVYDNLTFSTSKALTVQLQEKGWPGGWSESTAPGHADLYGAVDNKYKHPSNGESLKNNWVTKLWKLWKSGLTEQKQPHFRKNVSTRFRKRLMTSSTSLTCIWCIYYPLKQHCFCFVCMVRITASHSNLLCLTIFTVAALLNET